MFEKKERHKELVLTTDAQQTSSDNTAVYRHMFKKPYLQSLNLTSIKICHLFDSFSPSLFVETVKYWTWIVYLRLRFISIWIGVVMGHIFVTKQDALYEEAECRALIYPLSRK